MARPSNRLAALFVTKVRQPGLYADGGGLYLRVDAGGARRWCFIFQWRGRRREMGLGSALAVDLKAARAAAATSRGHVAAGRDPVEQRKLDAARACTFGALAEALVEDLEGGWRNAKHAAQWTSSLKAHAARLWDMPVAEVGTDDVLRALRPIWGRIPETASRVRGRIEHVLDAARAQGLRAGENPARWRGHLDKLLSRRATLTRGHFAAMPFAEVPAFVGELRARPAIAAAALEFTIFTASRSGMTLGARWGEFDLVEKVWTVPGERMKGGRAHRVPLSGRAVEILEDLRLEGEAADAWVFRGSSRAGRLSNMAMAMLLRRMGRRDVTVHGFRSSFRDWAGEATNFPSDVAEAALAHVVGNKVEQAYRRGDALAKRRRLMDAWAGYLGRPAMGGRILDFRRPG